MEGSHIEARRGIIRHRDYLDNRLLSPGASIDLYDEGMWVPGRYEANSQWEEGYFCYTDANGQQRALTIEREKMRFRWPPKE
jgi:hypothetical protein